MWVGADAVEDLHDVQLHTPTATSAPLTAAAASWNQLHLEAAA